MTTTHPAEKDVLGTTLLPYILDLGRNPSRPAFARIERYRRERWSRGAVLAGAMEVAAWLEEIGVQPGERVVLHGANSPAWVAAFYGCLLAGAVAVPVEASLPAQTAGALARRVDPVAGLGDAPVPVVAGLPWRDLRDLRAASPRDPGDRRWPGAGRAPGDLVQIVFTSGTTGRSRAVPITYRNLMAGVHPLERGYRKPRRQRLVRWLRPRLLCLVPASHLFGQVVGLHLPVLMGLSVTFLDDLRPRAVRAVLREEKVSAVLAVPRILRLLRDDLRREGLVPPPAPADASWVRRVWRARKIHRLLGWRFAAWVSGGAALEEEVEEFWSRLGYLVVQGYGLTETAPIISVSNPFARRRGSVGRPLPGQEIRVGPGGELWVRGANVASGYLDDSQATAAVFQDGWLRTGDRVERDTEGRLYVRGRLKDVIVLADGTNVDPAPVEGALEASPWIREAACIGRDGPRGEEVHAVLVPSSAEADLEAAVREANRRLPPGSRVQGYTVWKEAALPRTSLGKLRRAAVREAVAARTESSPAPGSPADPVASALADLTGRDAAGLAGATDLDRDLGLSSLDRLDLVVRLEEATGRTLDEEALSAARTLGELREASRRPPVPPLPMPRWVRSGSARLARAIGRAILVTPVFRTFCRVRVVGRAHLAGLEPPFLLAANHLSHMDTPAVLYALPRRLRRRMAVAMATEHFPGVFGDSRENRLRRWGEKLGYQLVVLLFQAYPLPRHGGFSATLAYTGELTEAGACPLIFPEGRMRRRGEPPIPFREGPALLAQSLRLPIVPVGLEGTGARLPPGTRWPRPGRVIVRFGEPLHPETLVGASDVRELTLRLEQAVRRLSPG
ncbi:MAG: AMP-binding protein [Acidobacteriota bacterium]